MQTKTQGEKQKGMGLQPPRSYLNHGPSSGTESHVVEAGLPEVLTSACHKALI